MRARWHVLIPVGKPTRVWVWVSSSLPVRKPVPVWRVRVFAEYGYRYSSRYPRVTRALAYSQLLAARQQQSGSTNGDMGEAANDGNSQERAIDLPVGKATEHAEPWQLQYYDPPTRDVIERAKQFSHCDAASINPFPNRAAFNTQAVEYINEAIAERRAQGLIISDGK